MSSTIIVIDGGSFMRAFGSVEHAAAREPERPILTAILFEVDEAGARLVAADNYRVAVADLHVLVGEDERVRLPIRRDDLLTARRAMPKDLAVVTFTLDGYHHVLVEWEGASFRLPVIDGTYPNVSRIFHDAPGVVALDARYLGDLRHHKRRPVAGPLVVHIAGPEQPVIFEMAGVREAIMPVRGVVPMANLEADIALAETHE